MLLCEWPSGDSLWQLVLSCPVEFSGIESRLSAWRWFLSLPSHLTSPCMWHSIRVYTFFFSGSCYIIRIVQLPSRGCVACGDGGLPIVPALEQVAPPHSLSRHGRHGAVGSVSFVLLGPRNGNWTSHRGVAGCGSLRKGRWPTSSWRTGPLVKAQDTG